MDTSKLNLIDGGFQNSGLFLHMPLFDGIFYEGFLEGKIRKYKAIHEEQPCTFLGLNVIRKEEDILWKAVEDFIKRSVSDAAFGGARGVYTFDLLSIDIHKEVNTFNHNDFTTVILNHSRKLKPGEKRLIKYSSAYGILQKMVHEDWGKIALKTSVEVFKDKVEYLDLLIKQLIKDFAFSNEPSILLLHDLSQSPIFDPGNEMQQKRIKAVIEKQIPETLEYLPEVYIQDKNGVRELLSGSVI